MRVRSVNIRNFRRLKSCKLDIGRKETIFVGANNSGKTTAMNALYSFLSSKEFHTQDFTLSNWDAINAFGKEWEKTTVEKDENLNHSLDIANWDAYLPQLDLWLDVEPDELHHVCHMIPTLDWDSGLLGLRLRLEPKNIELDLYPRYSTDYRTVRKNAKDTSVDLYPKSLWDYLDRGQKLSEFFEVKYYILDPAKYQDEQITPSDCHYSNPLKGLIKIDAIQAQRGFSDANDKETGIDNLSKQLQSYYKRHLLPDVEPTKEDIDALANICEATKAFGERLKYTFSSSLGEIEGMNYPGFGNPSISIEPSISLIDGLNHQSAVRFAVDSTGGTDLRLSEKYNGLGYQNLISMSYKLISFRDDWMRVGKHSKGVLTGGNDDAFEPIHLVLVEEPEAHLHVQVQQVFVKQAYKLLRHHSMLIDEQDEDKKQFSTQLIVSTHSSHIAHEVEFKNLRYFKRDVSGVCNIPTSTVVNLSETFGVDDVETKFVTRYLKATHCDLFFADAVILVEGATERMFIPSFIKNKFNKLSVAYVSIIEILGSHAHTLRPLIDKLGVSTLIITDIDTYKDGSKVLPCKGDDQITNNDTLKKWIPCKTNIDDLAILADDIKCSENVRVAYPYEMEYVYKKGTEEQEEVKAYVIPYTFEDALALDNIELIRGIDKSIGLLKKFNIALSSDTIKEATKAMYDALDSSSKKAEFAIELLYSNYADTLVPPSYISEGLLWLENNLKSRK